MATEKVGRRDFVKYIVSGAIGAIVAGGIVASYYSMQPPPEKVVAEKTIERTVTKTVTATPPSTTVTVTAAPPTPAKTQWQETLVIGASLTGGISIDPAKTFEFITNVVNVQLYDRLVGLGPKAEGVPTGLATSWERDPDNVTWRFKIRKGVKFWNGDPMTAEDLEWSYKRVIAIGKGSFHWFNTIGLTDPEKIKALDKETLQLQLTRPTAPGLVLQCLASFPSSAVNRKLLEPHMTGDDKWAEAWIEKNSAGTGPFVLDKWEKDKVYEMHANELYWKGAPRIKKIIINHVPEYTTQRLQLEKGDIDIAFDLPIDHVVDLEKKPGFLVHRTLDLNMKYIAFNVGMKPFDNIKVREAIRYSIDYDGIVNDLFKGEGVVQQSIIPFNLLGGNPRKPYKKDIVKAKQLLAEAGYPNGFDTEMWYVAGYPWLETVVPKIQADLAEAGIRVKLVPTTGAEISERRAAQAIPMYILGWGGGLAHPENYVGAWTDYDRKLMAYWMKFDDPKAKELTAKTGIAASDEEAKKIYDELTEYMFQNGPYAVWALLYHHWVSRDYVTRLDVHPVLWLYTIFDTAYKNPPS